MPPRAEETLEVDVVVVGGGMGGLVAGVAAQEDGARVLCLEKAPDPGGSFALAGGYVWTVDSTETYDELVPHGDAALGHLVIEDYDTGIEWLQAHSVTLQKVERGIGHEKHFGGHRVVPDTVTSGVLPLRAALTAAGGTLMTGATVVALHQDDLGGICGVRYRDGRGRAHDVRCAAVVLATGGFQGDLELMTRYISRFADRALLRSNPGSTGDGLRLALAAGASVSRGMSAFYGHLLPAPPARIEPEAFRKLSQFYSSDCLVVNGRGVRFVDESGGDEICALGLIAEPAAAGYVIFDAVMFDEYVKVSPFPDMDPFDPRERIRDAGGVVLAADSVDELAAQLLSDYGVSARNFLETIEEFNAAALARDPSLLSVPRRTGLRPCATPPFHAVPVRPGVTFTEGGTRVNESCQVLDRDSRPIPGLYAAGADVGGISVEGYVGGLAPALVTGLRAGVFAARAEAT